MSTCDCPAGTLTSFAFSNGVVLQRCRTHDVQTWTGGDRTASGSAPLRALKDLFVEERGNGKRAELPARRTPLPSRAVRAAAPRSAVVTPGATTDDLLTALLNARGLTGAWSVA